MNLARFELHRPQTLDQATELKVQLGEDAALYAGGTELLLAMKLGLAHWPHLIDLKQLPELDGVELEPDRVRIGARATHMEIERSPLIQAAVPGLSRLEGRIANVRVRAAGTLIGNICFGEPHADPPTLLAALGAEIELQGPGGRRTLPLIEFMTGAYENALQPEEIALAVRIPRPGPGVQAGYRNFKVLERPCAGVAVVGRVEEGRFSSPPQVYAGSADEIPRAVPSEMLKGAGADDQEALAELARQAARSVDPIDDLSGSAEYKRHLIGVLARRAALDVLRGTEL